MEALKSKIESFLRDGYGSGYGYGDGSGYGSGSGDIKTFNGKDVYMVDEVATLIDSVKGNVARGHIVNSDFSLSKTFIAKVGGSFAHGETIEKAMSDATRKHLEDASTEERVDEFLKQFDGAADYSAEELMEGYRLLSGACEQGCLSFMKNKSIIAADRFTLTQFVDIVLGAYSPGDEAILILKKRLSD